MAKVLAFTVTRADSSVRARLLQETITSARKTAGIDFDWMIVGSGCGQAGRAVLDAAYKAGQIEEVMHFHDNIGQHVAWNLAFDKAQDSKYDLFLRLDDDCDFITKRWLKKLVEFSTKTEHKMCISPTIRGLRNPPNTSQVVDIEGVPVVFSVYAVGGICRLHPVKLFKDFVADVRKPVGGGDATGIANYCRDKSIPMVYVKHVRIKHVTQEQEDSDMHHFAFVRLFQHIPYIPAWKAADEK